MSDGSGNQPGPSPCRPRLEALALGAAYCLLFLLWRALGGRFQIAPDLWQLLPAEQLEGDLARSLLDLHAQPPLLNLLYGLALKAAAATGSAPEDCLAPSFFASGLASVLALGAVGRRLLPSPPVRWVALAIVLLNPYLYAAHGFFLYTPLGFLFLSLTTLGALRYFERSSLPRLLGALVPAFLLVHTRSAYHFLWLALLCAALLLLQRRRRLRELAPQPAVAVLVLALACIWPAKNLFLFGFFGSSSWQGLNLSRGLPMAPDPVFRQIFLSDRAVVSPAAAEAIAARFVEEEHRGAPTLSRTGKRGGGANWNHLMVLATSREMGRRSRELLAREPLWLARKALVAYSQGFSRWEGRHPYSDDLSRGYIGPDLGTSTRWSRGFELAAFQPFRAFDPARPAVPTTGFAFLFPAGVAAVAAALWRRRRASPGPGVEEATAGVVLLTLGWVLLLALAVDGAESARMRYPAFQPFLLVLGWALVSLAAGRRRATAEGEP